MVCVPASSTVWVPTPDCCKYKMTGPVIVAPPAQLKLGYRPLVPSEHSMEWEPCVTKFSNPCTLENAMRPFAKPMNTCVVDVRDRKSTRLNSSHVSESRM